MKLQQRTELIDHAVDSYFPATGIPNGVQSKTTAIEGLVKKRVISGTKGWIYPASGGERQQFCSGLTKLLTKDGKKVVKDPKY